MSHLIASVSINFNPSSKKYTIIHLDIFGKSKDYI